MIRQRLWRLCRVQGAPSTAIWRRETTLIPGRNLPKTTARYYEEELAIASSLLCSRPLLFSGDFLYPYCYFPLLFLAIFIVHVAIFLVNLSRLFPIAFSFTIPRLFSSFMLLFFWLVLLLGYFHYSYCFFLYYSLTIFMVPIPILLD